MSRPSPTAITPAHVAVYERHVVRAADGECYGWDGPLTKDGYPRVRYFGARETAAARVAWWALHGTVPEAVVPAACGCRTCTNPAHLQPSRRRGQPPAFFGRVSYARR